MVVLMSIFEKRVQIKANRVTWNCHRVRLLLTGMKLWCNIRGDHGQYPCTAIANKRFAQSATGNDVCNGVANRVGISVAHKRQVGNLALEPVPNRPILVHCS